MNQIIIRRQKEIHERAFRRGQMQSVQWSKIPFLQLHCALFNRLRQRDVRRGNCEKQLNFPAFLIVWHLPKLVINNVTVNYFKPARLGHF